MERKLGFENFNYPGTWKLLNLPPKPPTIVHCHNLHGFYFDLRFLPRLSQQIPVILNLRDTWLLTGHCAHFMDCERWKNRVWPSSRLFHLSGDSPRWNLLQLASQKKNLRQESLVYHRAFSLVNGSNKRIHASWGYLSDDPQLHQFKDISTGESHISRVDPDCPLEFSDYLIIGA